MQGMAIDAKKVNAAGKGAAPRKGAQNEKYRANFDRIFRSKREATDEPETTKH